MSIGRDINNLIKVTKMEYSGYIVALALPIMAYYKANQVEPSFTARCKAKRKTQPSASGAKKQLLKRLDMLNKADHTTSYRQPCNLMLWAPGKPLPITPERRYKVGKGWGNQNDKSQYSLSTCMRAEKYQCAANPPPAIALPPLSFVNEKDLLDIQNQLKTLAPVCGWKPAK